MIKYSPMYEREQITTNDPKITDINLNGRQVRLVEVEHRGSMSRETLGKIISGAGAIGMEYFLPELEVTAVQSPVVGNLVSGGLDFLGIRNFSAEVISIAKDQKKDIVVMDPANNVEFEMLNNFLPNSSALLGLGAFAFGLINMDRRNFLKVGSIGGLTLFAAGLEAGNANDGDTPIKINMTDLRRVTIAQGLAQDSTEDLVMLYPSAHIKGISPYLDNHDLRKWKYSVYSQIPGITRSIRRYTIDSNGRWTLVSNVPIS